MRLRRVLRRFKQGWEVRFVFPKAPHCRAGRDRRGRDWRLADAAVLAAAVPGQWGVFFETRNTGGEAVGPWVDELPPGSV